jgi:Uma2 family endonuclease
VQGQFVPHARFQTALLRRLADAVDQCLPGYLTLVEASIRMPPRSMPEPDIAVTNFAGTGNEPVPVESVALIVEVSSSTARYDLSRKARLYAAAGVPEYWVADLDGGKLHQLWSPAGKAYQQRRQVSLGERVEAVTIAGLAVETAGIIPS